MAAAGLADTTLEADNDNWATPGLWRRVVDGLAEISPPLGAFAAKEMRRGVDVFVFIDHAMACLESVPATASAA